MLTVPRNISETIYPIRINGIKQPIDTINVDGSVYVPIRNLCNYIDLNVDWNDSEQTVELNTNNNEFNKEELGIPLPLNIDEDTAVKIANVIFEQYIGSEELNNLELSVEDSNDGKCYRICRYPKMTFGGQLGILINKSNGEIMGFGLGD